MTFRAWAVEAVIVTVEKLGKAIVRSFGQLYSVFPFDGVKRPVFIVGCGRSGTTIFGESLSQHPEITYLNEPRHLWFSSFPETDIWTKKASTRRGKLVLTGSDVDATRSRKLGRLFRFETIKTGKPVLVEKLPINSFRLPFIVDIFPDARFIHVARNGVEVARSIEKAVEKGWFGANEYKWGLLVNHLYSQDDTRDLLKYCSNDYERGLLEWRLSVDAINSFFETIPTDRFLQITYAELNEKPVDTIDRVFSFLGLQKSKAVSEFVTKNIERRSQQVRIDNLSENEEKIAGDLLGSLQ